MVDDAELVARCRNRDRAAFGALVDRHQRLVFGVALARTRDPALAEDVAQEAFVAAWRDLGRLRDGDRVGPWVAGIARNLAAGAVRTRVRREATALPIDDGVAASPEDEALAAEDRALLARALAEVPEAFREVLVLFYLEGESVARIAAALEIREDLVKQRLARGRRALRESVARRVESALDRARQRPGLRAGVLAAIGALGAATHAAHAARAATTAHGASSAGKVVSMTLAKQLALGGAALAVVAGGALWLAHRDAHASKPDAPATPAARIDKPAAAKLMTPAQHAERLAAIRAEAARNKAAAPAAPASAPSSSPPAATANPGHDNEVGGPAGDRPPPIDGDMDKEYVKAAMQDLIPLLNDCYTQALAHTPTLAGSVEVDFTIEGQPDAGGVISESTIDVAHSTLADAGMQECVQQTMYALDIAAPNHGDAIKVHYPFTFSNN